MRFVLTLAFSAFAAAAPLRFEIKLDPSVAPHGSSGRLLVFLADAKQPREILSGGFVPGETWIAAKEVEWFASGSTIVFDADVTAYPKPFSQAAPGVTSSWPCSIRTTPTPAARRTEAISIAPSSPSAASIPWKPPRR